MTALLAAVGLLTRLPVRRAFDAADVARATAFFPVVGAVVGGIQVVVLWLCSIHVAADRWMQIGPPNVPPFALAVCLVALGVCLTGAIHLDGLADMADGFGGGRSREDVLRIMRDPSVGSYGATAIVLLVMLKVACLSTLLEQRTAAATLFVAPVLGRWSMALLGQWLPYARTQGGLGAVVTDQAARGTLLVATPLAAVLTAAASGRKGLVFWGVTIAVTVMIGRVCQRRLGGFTGDTLGACAELSEAAVWLAAVMIAS